MWLLRSVVGFGAGAAVVLGAVTVLALSLLSISVLGFLYTLSSGGYAGTPAGSALGAAVVEFGRGLPGLYWGAPWAALLAGLLGVLLALADTARPRVRRSWADRLGLVVTIGTLVAGLTVWRFSGSDASESDAALQLAGELYGNEESLLGSNVASLVITVMFSALIAAGFWLAWSWWYDRLARRLGVVRPARRDAPLPAEADVEDRWYTYGHGPATQPAADGAGMVADLHHLSALSSGRIWVSFALAGAAVAGLVDRWMLSAWADRSAGMLGVAGLGISTGIGASLLTVLALELFGWWNWI
ncbi:MAG: hypothetical protein M3281_08245 [Chloroflexota bacterium]|nr:hypothetical protein [Chloroflexota bacterium]